MRTGMHTLREAAAKQSETKKPREKKKAEGLNKQNAVGSSESIKSSIGACRLIVQARWRPVKPPLERPTAIACCAEGCCKPAAAVEAGHGTKSRGVRLISALVL